MQRWALSAVLFGLLSTPALPQDEAEMIAAEFAINNSIFVLYHELGHLLIGELSIAVLGKEEDAADNIAAILMLNSETDEADTALIDSADGWFLSDAANESGTIEDADLYDVHSLDVQRAFQVICLMVGARPETFADIATEAGLDPERQESCAADFVQASSSWGTVLDPHAADANGPPEISVRYEPSENAQGAKELLESAGILEHGAEAILSAYALPRPVTLRAAECGEANAYYDPDATEVVFCYEMVDHFYGLYLEAEKK